jgi:acetyl esterase/lipase
MFAYSPRQSWTRLVFPLIVITALFAVGACSAPRLSPTEEQATPTPNRAPPSTTDSPPPKAPTPSPPSPGSSPTAEAGPAMTATTAQNPVDPFASRVPTIEPGPYEVQLFANIPYTSKAKLDVYAPVEPGEWPVVVVYHGGLGTTKEAMRRLSTSIAGYGAVVFVPNWRTMLTPELEQGAEDAACAIRFARKHSADYGGISDRITGAGHSAGAMIVALMGLVGDEFRGDCLVEGGSGYPDGVVALEGPYNMLSFSKSMFAYEKASPDLWEKLSPMFYPAKIPPREGVKYHIFISDLMNNDAKENTATFFKSLQDAGYLAELTILPNVRHVEFDEPMPETVQAILDIAWNKDDDINQ